MQKLKIAQSRQSFSKQAFVKSHLPEAKDLKSPGIIDSPFALFPLSPGFSLSLQRAAVMAGGETDICPFCPLRHSGVESRSHLIETSNLTNTFCYADDIILTVINTKAL